VQLEAEHLRRSRRAAISVRMTQSQRPVLQALVRTAAQAPGYEYQHAQAPSISPPEALRCIDTGVWFHQFSPASEWLLIDQESVVGARGLLGARGSVWDPSGRLLATGGSQLCCIPAPAPA
jgi:Acyl-CoA thioesterase C-terminal domain